MVPRQTTWWSAGDELVEEYKDDIPQEMHRWRNNVCNNCVPESCTLKIALSYTSDLITRISVVFCNYCYVCQSVHVAVNVHFQLLRILKTCIRASMTESILCGLSMLHIHRSDTVGEINTTSVLKNGTQLGTAKKKSLLFFTMPSQLMNHRKRPDFSWAVLFWQESVVFVILLSLI
jgi:hypothetical protein